MNSPEPNDPLDALLREQNSYVEDNGFTTRVIKSLPRRRRAWLRPVLLLGATTIGAVLAAHWLSFDNLPPLDLSALTAANSQALLPWMLVVSVVGSLVWSAVTALEWQD
jgi:hypothetical protein